MGPSRCTPVGRPVRFPVARRAVLPLVLALCGLLAVFGTALAKRGAKSPDEAEADPRVAAMAAAWRAAPDETLDMAVVTALAGLGDRATGTAGCRAAAAAVETYFRSLGAGEVGRQTYQLPVMVHGPASLAIPGRPGRLELAPLALNAFTPGALPEKGLTGPLVAAGQAAYRDFDGSQPPGRHRPGGPRFRAQLAGPRPSSAPGPSSTWTVPCRPARSNAACSPTSSS